MFLEKLKNAIMSLSFGSTLFTSALIGLLIVFSINFFILEVEKTIIVPKYDYTLELTYADGTKKTVIDEAKLISFVEEPEIESPVLQIGDTVKLNGTDNFGIIAVRCINVTKSKILTRTIHKGTGLTRYDYYRQLGCPLKDAICGTDEYLIEKKFEYEHLVNKIYHQEYSKKPYSNGKSLK